MASPSQLVSWGFLLLSLLQIGQLSEAQVSNRRPVNQIHVDALRSQLLYPYEVGHRRGEITNAAYQSLIQLGFHIPFFGLKFNYTWVSLHGYLAFHHAPYSSVYPIKVPRDDWPTAPDPAFIAPYYSLAALGTAADPKVSGLYYKEFAHIDKSTVQDEIDLQEAVRLDLQQDMIGVTDFVPKHILIVTWKNFTFSGSKDLKRTNTYQVVLATDDIRCYILFNYELLMWTTSTAAQGDGTTGLGGKPALVGFNAGNGSRAFEYKPYSQTNEVLHLTIQGNGNGHPGRHMFRIDEQIIQGMCNYQPDHLPVLVLSPDHGSMLGGTLVNISGPCFDPGQRIQVKFHDQEVPCVYLNRNLATFVTPSVKAVGFVEVTAILESGSFHFRNKFYIENPMYSSELVWFDQRYLLNNLEVDNFRVYWSKSNISHPVAPKKVHINLFGYGESGIRPDLVFIRQLKEGPNSGQSLIDMSKLENTVDERWKMDLKIGLIQVNATQKIDGVIMTTSLWSRPFPLGWYFRTQWKEFFGNNWSKKFCQQWRDLEVRRPALALSSLPPCPCTMEQAQRDKGRFAPDPDCDEWGNRECSGNKNTFHCLMSAQPTNEGSSQHCCYGFDGQLLTLSDNKIVGHPWRAHPLGLYPYDDVFGKTPGLSHWHQDLWGQVTCCQWEEPGNDTCEIFNLLRPPNHCDGYQPTTTGIVFGDPHIITFDGYQYTFNGKGEFTLLNVKNQKHVLDAQVRFQQFVDIVGTAAPKVTPATVVTAIAAKENVSSTVEVHVRPTEARWRYRLTVTIDGHPVYLDRPHQKMYNFNGVTVYTPTNVINQSHIIMAFQSGAGIEIFENRGFIAVWVSLPDSFKTNTRGLLGNWSSTQSNDLTKPDGSLAPGTNFQEIHTEFGLKWLVTDFGTGYPESKSIFHYENGRTSNFYFDPDFRPVMDKAPPVPETIDKTDLNRLCGLDSSHVYQCLFDFVASGNRELAVATKTFYDEYMMKKTVPEVKGRCPPLRVKANVHLSTLDRTVGTVVKFGCGDAFRLEGTTSTTCQADHTWSKLEFGEPHCVREGCQRN